MYRIESQSLDLLLQELKGAGYQTVGPRVDGGSIVYGEITTAEDLPQGWRDRHEPGKYSLTNQGDRQYFGFVVGPHSFKKFLFPPKLQLFSSLREGNTFAIADMIPWNGQGPPRYAFIGVRACELAAIAVQDNVFMNGRYTDPVYERIRKESFIVAVNCLTPGANCFCASMNTGPAVKEGFDLLLTEVVDKDEHWFMVQTGSGRGDAILRKLPFREGSEGELQRVMGDLERASGMMAKDLNTDGLKELLSRNHDHPEWDKVGKRCLSCANCTMVCPTCFCSTVRDVTDLSGEHAGRWREWDSCFTLDFARVSGGNFRPSPKARYRQWLTHKLGTWHDQFGTSGCVGCGRCITWCPVGIDITEEAKILQTQETLNEGK
jgi:ferredoxin